MTPQTKARRGAMIDQIITDTALGYRFDDNQQPRMTEDRKSALDEIITQWNQNADSIDEWAALTPKFADGYIGLRLGWSDAFSCQFRLTEGATRAGAELPTACWRAIGILDDLAEHVARGATRLAVPVELVQWMADGIFLSMIPPEIFERAAHVKGHIWDRRLRHNKRAKARKRQAVFAEGALAEEDERQEAEFRKLLQDTMRRHKKFQTDIRSDRNSGDVAIAPPRVKIVRLSDRKGFMLLPAEFGRAKKPPKAPSREPQAALYGLLRDLAALSPLDAASKLNQMGISGPADGRWDAGAIVAARKTMRPKRQSERTIKV